MKHLIIGDLHGKDCWKEADINRYDKVVFLGDYVDHWTLPDVDIFQNLLEIIEIKKNHPEKIILLLGNHDVQYLHYPEFLCSGFRPSMQRALTFAFKENRELFNIAYQRNNYLFTHAGVTNSWYAQFLKLTLLQQIRDDDDTVADMLNKIEQTRERWLLHQAGASRGGCGHGGPTWADRKEMKADLLEGYHQVVGHTVIPEVEVFEHSGNTSVTFIDVLDTYTYFYEMDI